MSLKCWILKKISFVPLTLQKMCKFCMNKTVLRQFWKIPADAYTGGIRAVSSVALVTTYLNGARYGRGERDVKNDDRFTRHRTMSKDKTATIRTDTPLQIRPATHGMHGFIVGNLWRNSKSSSDYYLAAEYIFRISLKSRWQWLNDLMLRWCTVANS